MKSLRSSTRSYFSILSLSAIILAAPSEVCGWNSRGHQVIAYIAYQNLDANVKDRVNELLKKHPAYHEWRVKLKKEKVRFAHAQKIADRGRASDGNLRIFLLASTWADDIRTDRRFYDAGKEETKLLPGFVDMERHASWHFYAQPFSADDTPTESTKLNPPHLRSMVSQLYEEIGDFKFPENTRADRLAWFIHLIGDMHQPLHCATRVSRKYGPPLGDLSGNFVKVKEGTRITSLHAYWDNLLGTSLTFRFVESRAALLMRRYQLKPLEWEDVLNDSFKLAQDVVYKLDVEPMGGPYLIIEGDYPVLAQETADRQVALAGYRLAADLNELFASRP
jgi:hypothetical protein